MAGTSGIAQGKVNAEIIMKLDALDRGIADANAKLRRFSTGITNQSKINAKAMSAAWIAGFALISVVALKLSKKITSAFKNMVGVYAEFEQSLANTQSVARASAEELDRMEAAARRVGATTRSTASQAANALYYLASAGFSAGEAIAALDGVNALAIATQSDLAKTSETVAVTIRQYGLEASAATDIANTFTAAITSSLATMDKLAKSFEYVGPLAAGLGLTVEETTGALLLLYNKGFSGEKAGRGLRSILADLADSTSVVNRKLGELNISFSEVNPAVNKFADIMDTLREKGVNAGNAVAFFGKVSGVQLGSLISLASDAEGGMIELTEAVTGTNRAFEAMEIQMNTLKGSFDKFKNAEEALKISIGKELEPALRRLTDTATSLIIGVNKLHPVILAIVSVVGTLAAIATLASVAIVGLKLALASAVIAPVLAALWALIVPLTLIGTAAVAAAAGISALKAKGVKDSVRDFGDLAKEMGATEDQIETVAFSLNKLNYELRQIAKGGPSSINKLKQTFEELSRRLGFTKEQVLKVAIANKELIETHGDLIIEILAQVEAEKTLADAQELRWLQAFAMTELEVQHRSDALARFQQMKKEKKLLDEQAGVREKLRVAFERSKQLVILHGDAFDRNAYLVNVYNKSLETLVNQGEEAHGDAITNQIKLYQELQDEFGKVLKLNKEDLTDKEKNIGVRDRLASRLRENVQLEILAIQNRTEYNKELEDSQAVLDAIGELIGEDFKIEGGAIQQLLKDWGDLIILGEERIKLTEEYRIKLEELNRTELEQIRDSRAIALEGIGIRTDEYEAIVRYFNKLEEINALETDTKKIVVLTDYKVKLEELGRSEKERLEHERQAAKDKLDDMNKESDMYKNLIADIDAFYDKLEDNRAFKEFFTNLTAISNLVLALGDIFSSVANNAIRDSEFKYNEIYGDEGTETKALNTALENIEDLKEAELLADRLTRIAQADSYREEVLLADATAIHEIERLEAVLEAALVSGDEIRVRNAENALANFIISEKYTQDALALSDAYTTDRVKAEEKMQREVADLNYANAMVAWGLALGQIAVNTAVSASTVSWNPFLLSAVIATGIASAIAVALNMPQKPTFKDGGVVPGSSYKGDSTAVLADAGELILNKTQQESVFDQMTNNDQPIYITINTMLDGKVVATNSAKYYRNGQVVI